MLLLLYLWIVLKIFGLISGFVDAFFSAGYPCCLQDYFNMFQCNAGLRVPEILALCVCQSQHVLSVMTHSSLCWDHLCTVSLVTFVFFRLVSPRTHSHLIWAWFLRILSKYILSKTSLDFYVNWAPGCILNSLQDLVTEEKRETKRKTICSDSLSFHFRTSLFCNTVLLIVKK